MTAPSIAASVALIASVGVVIDALEVVWARKEIDRLLVLKVVRPSSRTKLEAAAVSFVGGATSYSLFVMGHALLAFVSVYALAFEMKIAVATTAVVFLGFYLKDRRFPLGTCGADMMMRFIWLSLFLFALAQGPVAQTAALGVIAFHALWAYFVAGTSKLGSPFWRNGTAVGMVAGTEAFGVSAFAMVLSTKGVSPFFTWSTVAFEIFGPFLVLLGPEGVILFCVMAFLFHTGIAVVSGLLMFIFSFGASFPAIYWIVVQAQTLL